ncbi:hypothetical protein CSB20_10110 [bacterium DOLZORAL124_64_63]|nr:MAG: hypothetical protein CSB20_10110 [bacterium DOLZORAL124_64_63]
MLLGVMALALVGVVMLNVRTFMPARGSRETERGYRLQAHPPVPLDARPAGWETALPAQEGAGMTASSAVDELARDPFFPVRKQVVARRKAPQRHRARTAAPGRRAAKAPVCSAILLMGAKPMAIIDGKGYHPGEKMGQMTVEKITADAVVLRDSRGRTHRLGVGPEKNDTSQYRVVTRARATDEQGRTRLSDQ